MFNFLKTSNPKQSTSIELHCPGIGRNDEDWVVVSVSGESAAAYPGKTCLRMKAYASRARKYWR